MHDKKKFAHGAFPESETFLLPHNLCHGVKIYRKDQVNIRLLFVFNKTRSFCIHKIQIYFFIVNNTERIDQKLRIKSDQKIFSLFCARSRWTSWT